MIIIYLIENFSSLIKYINKDEGMNDKIHSYN